MWFGCIKYMPSTRWVCAVCSVSSLYRLGKCLERFCQYWLSVEELEQELSDGCPSSSVIKIHEIFKMH